MIFPSFSLSSPPGPFRVPFGDRRVHIDVQFGRDDGAQGLHHRGYYFFSLLFLRRISSCRLSSSTFLCRSSFSLSSASLSCFQVSFLASAWRVFNFFFFLFCHVGYILVEQIPWTCVGRVGAAKKKYHSLRFIIRIPW